jgi:uridine kinase
VLNELAAVIAKIELDRPLRVGIDGVDGAGKTTLADELAPLVEAHDRHVLRASVDDFHRPRDARYRRGELSPDGFYFDTFDYDAVRAQLLDPLGSRGRRRVRTRSWDHATDTPVQDEWSTVPDDVVLLCDGVFLHREDLVDAWDLTVFVAASIDVAVERGVQRDAARMPSAEATRERYRLRYTPAQRRYLEEQRPYDQAHFVLENTDPSSPVLHRRAS